MKKKIHHLLLLGMFSLIVISGCNQDDQPIIEEDPTILPTIETTDIQVLTSNHFTTTGVVISDKGYTITSKGICWSTNPDPTIDDNKTDNGQGATSFHSNAINLEPNTTYYYRAYATTKKGTGYGNTYLVTTTELFVDAEGNKYETVKIGDQVWMMENLKTSKYIDGTNIDTEDCLDYADDPNNTKIYGKLYSNSINANNLTPDGWRIPSRDDWEELRTYLGGGYVAGGKLKEKGTSHWKSPNTGADNSAGFTALPAGCAIKSYYSDLSFYKLTESTSWFANNNLSLCYTVNYNNQNFYEEEIYDYDASKYYYSIRLIKN